MNRTPIKRRQELRLFPILLVLVFFLAGCADLKAIRKFADTSAEAETYKAITADYVDSLKRRIYYTQTKESRDKLAKRIRDREQLVDGILALHLAIYEYMQTLGELAADELVSYDKEMDSIAGELEKANSVAGSKITKEEITAGNAIAKLLLKAFMEGYRQKKLNEVITKANPSLQTLIACQKVIIQNEYISSLQEEEDVIDTYYGDIIASLASEDYLIGKINITEYYGDIIIDSKKEVSQKAILMLLRDKMQEKKDAIAAKKKAAETYIKVIDKIAEGHKFLFENKNSLSKDQILGTIKGYSSYISNLYAAVKALK